MKPLSCFTGNGKFTNFVSKCICTGGTDVGEITSVKLLKQKHSGKICAIGK